MVRMGDVWDRTQEVLSGRGGMLAGIAVVAMFVPAAVNAAVRAYMPPSIGAALIGAVLTLVVTVLALWGQLAIIAASTDPAVDRDEATGAANRRLAPALGVAVILTVLLAVAFAPLAVLLVRAGVDLAAISQGVQPAAIVPGVAALAALYTLVLGLALLFAGVRLVPLYAVVLHERRGAGAIARCWRLTRRHSWRLVGVVVLFLIVLGVATIAAQSVVGLALRLILGGDAVATVAFLATLAGQAASTALTLVAIVFSAQLYVALIAREAELRARADRSIPPIADA